MTTLSKVFLRGIIAIDKLPSTPETLWLNLKERACFSNKRSRSVMVLPREDVRRSAVVKLLATWKVSIEVSGEIDAEDRELIMNLSQAYLEDVLKVITEVFNILAPPKSTFKRGTFRVFSPLLKGG
ncbi:hypothetical protein [Scytonema sp. NUACC26]|uniref:hypothetical protein n=1 Tax=Scytonema sp. NUACC26 TaxID=3140176 RepID=UPI0034DCBB6D